MDLIVEDELPGQRIGALCGRVGLGRFGRRHIEELPEHVVERNKGGSHAAGRAKKVPAVHPKPARVGIREFLEPLLKLALAPGLRQRIEFAVRHNPSWYRGPKRHVLGRLGLRELAFTQENRHRLLP